MQPLSYHIKIPMIQKIHSLNIPNHLMVWYTWTHLRCAICQFLYKCGCDCDLGHNKADLVYPSLLCTTLHCKKWGEETGGTGICCQDLLVILQIPILLINQKLGNSQVPLWGWGKGNYPRQNHHVIGRCVGLKAW